MERIKGVDANTWLRFVSLQEVYELDCLIDRCSKEEIEVIREETGWSELALNRRVLARDVTTTADLDIVIVKNGHLRCVTHLEQSINDRI